MYRKLAVILIMLTLISSLQLAKAEVKVGVKAGDWISYQVQTTGAPVEGHNIVSARMAIVEVNGAELKANVTTKFLNGTVSSVIRIFNFEDGNVQGWVVIPANLGVGDSFYDRVIDQDIFIETEEQKTVMGATRTITSASTPERYKEWDKATGVFVTTLDFLEGYTINATAVETNMWGTQILGLDQPVFYALMIVVAVLVVFAVVATVLIVRKKG